MEKESSFADIISSFDGTHGNGNDDQSFILQTPKQEPDLQAEAVLKTEYNIIELNAPYVEENNSILERNELRDLLAEWNLEYVYSKCKEEELTVEDLKIMTPRHCELLLRNHFKLSVLIKFQKFIKEWQKPSSLSKTTEVATQTDFTEDLYTVNKSIVENPREINVEKIILNSGDGKRIYENYIEDKMLNDNCRSLLVNIIIAYLFQNDIKMTVKLAENISNQIVELFSTETKETYYLKQVGKPPTGKVYAKYHNYVRSLKNAGVIKRRKQSSEEDKMDKIEESNDVSLETQSDEDDEEVQEVFAHNSTWEEVEMFYKATTKQRVKLIRNAISINEIFAKYVHYKKPLGFKLINIDFMTAFPNATCFPTKFLLDAGKLLRLLKNKVKDTQSIIICKQLDNKISEDGRFAGILYLLHAMLFPTNFLCKVQDGKQVWGRSTIQQSRDSFLQCGTTPLELKKIIEDVRASTEPMHPIILVTHSIVNPLDIIVYFDGTMYKFNNFLLAVDSCLKIYRLFNLNYPVHSVSFWTFIQKYFYNISFKSDKQNSKIVSLMNDLRCLS